MKAPKPLSSALPSEHGRPGGRAPGRAGAVALALFALPFAAVGLWGGATCIEHWQREGLREQTALRGLFGLVFGGAGFGLWALIPWLRRRQSAQQACRDRAPDQPWLWRPEWASGRIPCEGGAAVIFTWAFAGFWNLISAPLAWKLPEEWARGNHAVAIGALFPLVGVGLLVWAVRTTLHWRRFGRSVLELATRPGVVGGKLAGTVQLTRIWRPENGFRVALGCVRVRETGSGKNRSRHEDVLWNEERTVTADALSMGPRGTAVPVAFTIPRRLEPTSPEEPTGANGDARSSWIEWRVDVAAELPGVDYSARFEVPVFVTSESSDDVTDEDVRRERAAAVAMPERPLESAAGGAFREGSRIRVRRGAEGLEFVFPAARNPAGAAGATLFATVWTGIVYLLLTLDGVARFMAAIFGLFDVIIVWGALHLWLHSARVVANPSGLTVRSGILGWGRVKEVEADSLSTVVAAPHGQAGQKVRYAIAIHTSGRPKPLTVADHLPDHLEAEWLAGQMWKAVKGDVPRPDPPASHARTRTRMRVGRRERGAMHRGRSG